MDGLETRVQLLLGPPGTGKTTTTAVQVLLRILARKTSGDLVLVVAHTHTAVDLLLRRIESLLPNFVLVTGAGVPQVRLAKVHSSAPETPTGGTISDIEADRCRAYVNNTLENSVLVVGGTTAAVLKMVEALNRVRPFSEQVDGLQVSTLIVDEASMMVFPHFLALATIVHPDGDVLLAGDHRQLAPILAHDWEREDRPPIVLYQPFASAYEAIRTIIERGVLERASLLQSALTFTFRLPPLIRDLISRLYRLDAVELDGLPRPANARPAGGTAWEMAWAGTTGLFLLMHNERTSKQLNTVEGNIVSQLLQAAPALPANSVGIITPHRAQRTLLRSQLADFPSVDIVDTVERLQGGERQNIIVSATASDPAAIAASVEFILDLNRSNVAFSRAQDRLIVVCAETLLDHIPAEVADYESAMLWKSLRALCSEQIGEGMIDGYRVRVLTPPEDAIIGARQ
jgi:superfamily I DNA and/or RNA helicase